MVLVAVYAAPERRAVTFMIGSAHYGDGAWMDLRPEQARDLASSLTEATTAAANLDIARRS